METETSCEAAWDTAEAGMDAEEREAFSRLIDDVLADEDERTEP